MALSMREALAELAAALDAVNRVIDSSNDRGGAFEESLAETRRTLRASYQLLGNRIAGQLREDEDKDLARS
jgi:hypothetical protein